jgi:8-oxo-dGTP pyrophosphatase MutT (NUDIX family)
MSLQVHPDHWSNGPRVGSRAVVVVDNRILLLKYELDDEVAYLFPGGGHKPGETLAETAKREVYEETGLTVEIGRLLAVHEHQPSKETDIPSGIRAIYVSDAHRVDTFFECRVVGDATPNLDVAPDNLHTEFVWVALDELDDYPIKPGIAEQIRESLGHSGNPIFSEP